ncbi:MAG: NAD(P)/FAD-dependent oxidoreductase [Vicinamibacterales bacterium]
MDDVLIVGGGPAGALTALVLARAGLRVRVLERAIVPRDKLCGDTLNPGALEVLRRHLDVAPLAARARAIAGMRLTGPGRVEVRGAYRDGARGLALRRADLDHWLLDAAASAGARVDLDTQVVAPLVRRDRDAVVVAGVRARHARGADREHRARWVVAADGRRSRLMFGLGLARQPSAPRRWAVGAYVEGVRDLTAYGEMHVRRGRYIGVAPMPDGLANVCLVVPAGPGLRAPARLLDETIAGDPGLGWRFERASRTGPPMVLGPMAVDVPVPGVEGLLAVGDAAGFIDPMTGDGLRFAFRGAELAAGVVREVLDGGLPVHRAAGELASRRRRTFGVKWAFNRSLRAVVGWPTGVSAAAVVARVAPPLFTRVIRYAGDQS